MNKWVFMGRLTRDPEVRYTDGDTPVAVANFGIAVDKRIKRQGESADFFSVTAFGKLAEFAEKYLTKGVRVVGSGRIENNNYTRRDGTKVYGYAFIAEEIEFAESKAAADRRRDAEKTEENDNWMNVPEGDEELPFH